MDKQTNQHTHGREELKKFFRNGEIPTENHFGYLINSTVNKEDDGFAKDELNGLHLSSLESSKRLMTFYTGIDELTPLFYIDKHMQDKTGTGIKMQSAACPEQIVNQDENTFFFQAGGQLGIGKKSDPKCKLDVKGWVGMEGRLGMYKGGLQTIPANGRWHTILPGLNNCQAFEIVARAGKKGAGKFSMMHAIAVSAYGKSNSRVRKTCAYYGLFWNKLNLRWRGSTHDYWLEMRTNRNFGEGIQIYYSITRLWDDEEALLPEQYYYPSRDEGGNSNG